MNYINGSGLSAGRTYRCIATGDGTIVNDGSTFLATDSFDKKGNRLVVNNATGASAYASQTSVWSEV